MPVYMAESICRLNQVVEGRFHIERSRSFQQRSQVLAIHVLHNHEMPRAAPAGVIDRHEIRMARPCQCHNLSVKAGHGIRRLACIGRQDFDCRHSAHRYVVCLDQNAVSRQCNLLDQFVIYQPQLSKHFGRLKVSWLTKMSRCKGLALFLLQFFLTW